MSAQGEAASRPTKLGRYELITRIGQGGMADVQLALQRGPAGFEKLVVVKLVHDALASQKAFVDMLLDEARVAALVKHPNVVDIYDLGQAGGRYFIAMEYLEGEPLLAVLRAGREGKRLDPLSTGRVIADTAEGLDAAHELRSMSGEALELVHHDISLGNIVVLYNGQVKLVDFGVAKASQSAGPKAKVQGKFSYMAPEKLRGSSGDRRSDLFSLGCVMWEALTLKRLFRGGNDSETMKQVLEMAIQPPSKVNGDVSADFDPIVMRALDRNPANRHMTAKELAVEIEELLRKRGYGAKNDRVARYMQETFKTHIEARKKLVQEVVSKGSASAEMIDAAFRDPVFANGSPITPTANIEFAPPRALPPPFPQAVPTATNPVTDSSSQTEIGKPPWEVFTDTQLSQLSTHVVDPTRIDEHPPFPVATVGDRARAAAGRAKDATLVIARRARELAVDVAHDRKKLAIIGIAGGVFLVIMIGAIMIGGGGDAASKPAPALAAAAAPDASTAAPPELPIEHDPVIAAPAAGSATAPRAHDPVVAVEHPPPPPPPVEHHRPRVARVDHDHDHDHDRDREPKDKPDPDALFKQAVQAYVKGDSKAALGLLQKARSAAPGNAPTWRVLGQVYEKLGDRGSAKSAFLRYLSLAPSAPDAAQVRQRVERL